MTFVDLRIQIDSQFWIHKMTFVDLRIQNLGKISNDWGYAA